MPFIEQSTTSRRLRRLYGVGALAMIQVLAVGCGGSAAPDPSACDGSPCVRELAVGSAHACVRLDDGSVRCWGANTFGQAGVDYLDLVRRPTTLRLALKVDRLRLGVGTSCAFASGQLYCWGRNADFAASPGMWTDDASYPLPLLVPNSKISDVGLGRDVFCTLSSDGEVACVGNGAYGNSGLGPNTPPVPALTPIPGLRATKLNVGYTATCATLEAGGVSCWGDNIDRLIGPQADTGRAIETPRLVPELAELQDLRLSLGLACGVNREQIRCWGSNQGANADTSGAESVWPPSAIAGSEGLAQPSIGGSGAACAVDAKGRVQCWGSNENAQLGTGTADADAHPTPAVVPGLSSIASVAVGFDFACALTRTGHVSCWGANLSGQLGNDQRDGDFHAPKEVLW